MAVLATIRLRLPKVTAPCDAPLTLPELYAVWRAIPEERRFSFILALEEAISYQLIDYCAEQSGAAGRSDR